MCPILGGWAAIGQIGQTAIELRLQKGLLPLGAYSFATVASSDHKRDMSRNLQVIDTLTGLTKREKQKLKLLIVDHQVQYPAGAKEEVLSQLQADLRGNSSLLTKSVQKCIHQKLGRIVESSSIRLSIDEANDGDFYTTSNISSLCDINERASHEILERALLGIGGGNQKILDMKSFKGITSFRDDEVSIFDDRISFISSGLDPSVPKSQFNRVLEVTGLPSTDAVLESGAIDVNTLLRFKDSAECKDFRRWLWSVEDKSDEEIRIELNRFRQRVAELIRTPAGKLTRWGIGIGLSCIPVWGPSIGAAEGALDMFLLERLLPVEGPIYFVNRMLPSIYRRIDH